MGSRRLQRGLDGPAHSSELNAVGRPSGAAHPNRDPFAERNLHSVPAFRQSNRPAHSVALDGLPGAAGSPFAAGRPALARASR